MHIEYISATAPSVDTLAATLVEETTATASGNITSTGGENATSRGVQYDTNSGAPYASNVTESGSFGTGTFSENLSSLSKGTLYYFRAYATNSVNTSYGGELTFLTKPDPPSAMTATVSTNMTGRITLAWTLGTGSSSTYVVRKVGSYSANRTDGITVYSGAGTSYVDDYLTTGTTYYYSAWGVAIGGALTQYSDTAAQASATAATVGSGGGGGGGGSGGTIPITNTCDEKTNVVAVFTANTTNFIAAGFLNATATDSTIKYNGTDIPFQPAWGANPWCLFVSNVAASSTQTATLYMPVTGGAMRYFPGPGGMTVAESPTLWLSDNFTYTMVGWFDSTQVGANVTSKGAEFRVFCSGAGELSVTANTTTLVATGFTAGAHTVLVQDSTDGFVLSVDGVVKDSDAQVAVAVTYDDWTHAAGGSMLYLQALEITTGGTLVEQLGWQYGATFTDGSAYSHDATPTFRTTGTDDACVTAVLGPLTPVTTTIPRPTTTYPEWNMVPTTPGTPGGLYTEGGNTYPGYPTVSKAARDMGLPEDDLAGLIAFLTSFGAGIAVLAASQNYKIGRRGGMPVRGSLFLMVITTMVCLVVWNAWVVIPGWWFIPLGIVAVTLLVMRNPGSAFSGG